MFCSVLIISSPLISVISKKCMQDERFRKRNLFDVADFFVVHSTTIINLI